ncbi:Exodeoxyribonuclease 7 large subunit [Candidatus Filomicrobium marinum]|uniref:Exodeoxyribonuclease 7 large subunit n=1 Tax=Candidatus Filomicrobium marinum TaxID=1608628 RepID=A0A0D6J9Z7_9HYPH|nr:MULTISPECIES: exodeoxyribonuclease VII large subunit [Filomicrobium]MCV0368754.1 exodeoxyribonuclease VII large subunit [Filomicrobium sp.]CFW99046.1 Exodeoxyribonuclease 7 large subunit [Candidatus Filomicrobium marinum]CPR14994.1 Exodeoxyribonuclease 7 large subunit [Candidatus Filomicrobium marinum]
MTETLSDKRLGAGNAPEFSVSELSGAIKRSLEDEFEHVRVRGELGRISRPASGHLYLDLKDDRAVIAGVMWKGVAQRLAIKPEQGMEVIAVGRVTTFPGQSKYQLVIESLEPAGVGALMALLEARKKQFAEEGLFDEARKVPLPFLPRIVGIVTSPSGAVIRDMLHGFDERFPTRAIVWPVRVQGEGCAPEVAAAIRGFNQLKAGGPVPRPDVIIVARGGGSLEDLWGFNEEIVVRAVADSALPVISAVGHETDWTLIDLAADARAPTPTKAAEWAVPKFGDLVQRTAEYGLRAQHTVRRCVESARAHLRAAARGLPRRENLLLSARQQFDDVERRLGRGLISNTSLHAMRHARISGRLVPRLVEMRIARDRERLAQCDNRARHALLRTAGQRRTRLESVGGRLRPSALRSRLTRGQEIFVGVVARSHAAFANAVVNRRRMLDSQGKLLNTLSYQGVLARGFALVRDAKGKTLRKAAQIVPQQSIEIEFADGRVMANVTGDPGQADKPAPSKVSEMTIEKPKDERRPSRAARKSDQGSLF